jgi:uridine kinase
MKSVLISISGKSGVGKTTISNMMSHCIGPSKCLVLSTDDLHKFDRYDEAWKSMTHFNPDANNIELGDFHISNLLKGKRIHRSIYNHSTGRFDPPILMSSKPFIINEGLHAYYSNKMKQLSDFKIYVDTDSQLTTMWKVRRDIKYRERSESEVLASINSRKKDEHFIESQKEDADLIVKFFLENNEVNLSIARTQKNKNLLFDKIINDLVDYFNEISSLVRLSKLYGNDNSYVQGPAGNVSVKCLDNMLIKSSGIQLKDVDYFTGWSQLDINYLTEYFSFANNLDNCKYFYILNESIQNNTVPSMESGMHSILKRYVVHTHPDELIPILCHKDCESIIKTFFTDIDYCFVPLLMPGLELYEFIAKQDKVYDVYFLQNHGLVVTSDLEENLQLHDDICKRASQIKLDKIESTTEGYITPDEYIFRDRNDKWYIDMKTYYTNVKQSYKCNTIDKQFLTVLDNLEFEKHRKSL